MLTICLWKCLQKVALRIVSNIFNEYDGDYATTAMEAVPALCNLLQSADKTVRLLRIVYGELEFTFLFCCCFN